MVFQTTIVAYFTFDYTFIFMIGRPSKEEIFAVLLRESGLRLKIEWCNRIAELI